MRKVLVTILSSLFLAAASLSGLGGAPAAEAAVSFVSWPKDVVYVYDMTAAVTKADGSQTWPVEVAAERWDNDNPVDFRYTTKGCPKGAQCVVVQQSELPAPAVGSAVTGRAGADLLSATVVLDTTFGRTNGAARRANVVCHELGHALGLEHRTGTSSCMTSYVTTQGRPDALDVKNLVTMYGYR